MKELAEPVAKRHAGRRLDRYDNAQFVRGRSKFVEIAWLIASGLFVSTWVPGSFPRVLLLRAFGAEIGDGVVIKPRVQIKFPWRLKIGSHSWIGEGVWIDNLAAVTIGEHSVLSQGAYLCTGNHDWRSETFDLVTKPISIGNAVWICAMARIAPGVFIANGAIVGFAATATGNLGEGEVLRPQTGEATCVAKDS